MGAARAGLIDSSVVDLLQRELANLRGLPAPSLVLCHGDFSPRNWLLSDGRLSIFDFGEAGPDVWVSDLGRLLFGWRLAPEGVAALLDGYGRRPDGDELALLRATYAAAVVYHIVWGHEHGNHRFVASNRALLEAMVNREFG